MWIWEVHINTVVATKGHPNTENWEVKKNDGSSASAVPKAVQGHFPFESLWSVNMRRVQKIWTDELQQPIWLLQEEHLLVCQCRENLGRESYIKERRGRGQKRNGTGHCEIKLKSPPSLAAALNRSRQFKLVKGRNEFVMSSLIVGQLHVSRPDHHHHVHSSFLGCFCFCSDKRRGENKNPKIDPFPCEVK